MATKNPDDNELMAMGLLPADLFSDGTKYEYPESSSELPHDDDIFEPSEPAERPIRIVGGTEADKRDEIVLTPNVHLTAAAVAKSLTKDAELYQRSGSLVHVVPAEDQQFEGTSPGTPVIRSAPLSWLKARTSGLVRCLTKNAKGKYNHVPPPLDIVRTVIEQGHWSGIRSLRGIIETPSIRPDGSVIQSPGYDSKTGYLFAPGTTEWKPILDAPTLPQCIKAYEHLSEIFCDFPYVNKSHLSAVIAAILTLVARPAILGSVPCFLFDASAKRSGKSLQIDVISLIATGRTASRMSYPETDEELEKAISSFALAGASLVNFDNVARKFGGAALDKTITAVDTVDFRLLGKSEIVTVPWRAVIFASGNNVTCRGDMLARVLAPRLETEHENPETRDGFRFPELKEHVKKHRVALARAALTMVRGYFAAGRPDAAGARWGGFDEWARLVPNILRWVGAEDPMGARRGLLGDEDPTAVYEAGFVRGWQTLLGREGKEAIGLSIKAATAILYPPRPTRDPAAPPDGYDELRECVEALTGAKPGFAPETRRIGAVLKSLHSRPFGGFKLKSESAPSGGNVARWRIVPI